MIVTISWIRLCGEYVEDDMVVRWLALSPCSKKVLAIKLTSAYAAFTQPLVCRFSDQRLLTLNIFPCVCV